MAVITDELLKEFPQLKSRPETLKQQSDELAELKQELLNGEISKATLKRLSMENGVLDITMEGNIFHLFADSFLRVFDHSKAPNYLQANFTNDSGEAFSVTMQKESGITAAEKAHKLAIENEGLRKELQDLKSGK
jgi:hypothetical protein